MKQRTSIALSMLALTSCSNMPDPEYLDDEVVVRLFDGIEIGAPRSEVERVLGNPVVASPEKISQNPIEGKMLAWYLKNPPLPLETSPYMYGPIGVVYVGDRVIEKSLSPQVRR
jgi:hypothetical protein